MTNNKLKENQNLSDNKHFLFVVLRPCIMGSRKQLERVIDVHRIITDRNAYTLDGFNTFLFETMSLLGHLSQVQHLLIHAGFSEDQFGKKICMIRDEIRHNFGFDKMGGRADKRAKDLGKNENLLFVMSACADGVQCGKEVLMFTEIENYILRAEMLMYSTL